MVQCSHNDRIDILGYDIAGIWTTGISCFLLLQARVMCGSMDRSLPCTCMPHGALLTSLMQEEFVGIVQKLTVLGVYKHKQVAQHKKQLPQMSLMSLRDSTAHGVFALCTHASGRLSPILTILTSALCYFYR